MMRRGDQPSKEVLDTIFEMQNMGYTVVGSSIDPQDWDGKSADEIFKEVTKKIHNGHIILLHDAGGDRTPTIEALPKIIEWLKNKGTPLFRLVNWLGKVVVRLCLLFRRLKNPLSLFISLVPQSVRF